MWNDALVVARPEALKLVKNTVVLVQVAELPAKVIMNWDCLYRPALHIDIPNLKGKIVARKDVSSITRELDVGDRGDNFGEEGAVCRVLFFFEACPPGSV